MAENLLLIIIFLPLLGGLFILGARGEKDYGSRNAENVAALTVISNVFLILKLLSLLAGQDISTALSAQYSWHVIPPVVFVIGIDVLSLVLVLGVHFALLIGIIALRNKKGSQKQTLFFAMLYLSSLNGFFAALDVFSFYMFFALMVLPLFMEIGLSSSGKTAKALTRFYIYNFFGAFFLLLSVVIIYSLEGKNVLISEVSVLRLNDSGGVWVWSGIFLAFVSRIPVWPFHYWIASISTSIRNPLVLISANIMPVAGLYGFLRFWPGNVPEEIASLAPLFELLCTITMLFTALRGYSSLSLRDKIFSFATVYYLLYLSALFLPTDILQANVIYSLFAFLLVLSGLVMIVSHIEIEAAKFYGSASGILCGQSKASLAYSMLVLTAVGLPVSALFWNNFIIVSEIFNASLYWGTAVILTLILAAVSLMHNLYSLKDNACIQMPSEKIYDIDAVQFAASLFVMAMLFLSFIKPLWFVF